MGGPVIVTVTHQLSSDEVVAVARMCGSTLAREEILHTATTNLTEWIRDVIQHKVSEAVKGEKG